MKGKIEKIEKNLEALPDTFYPQDVYKYLNEKSTREVDEIIGEYKRKKLIEGNRYSGYKKLK